MKYKHVEPIEKDEQCLVEFVDMLSKYSKIARAELTREYSTKDPGEMHHDLVVWLNREFNVPVDPEIPEMITDPMIVLLKMIEGTMRTIRMRTITETDRRRNSTDEFEPILSRLEMAIHELIHTAYLAGRMGVGAVDEEDETLEQLRGINFGDLDFLEDDIDEHEDE